MGAQRFEFRAPARAKPLPSPGRPALSSSKKERQVLKGCGKAVLYVYDGRLLRDGGLYNRHQATHTLRRLLCTYVQRQSDSNFQNPVQQIKHSKPHHVLDAELFFLESLLEGVRLAEVPARVDEHEPPPLRFNITAVKTCMQGMKTYIVR